MTTPTDDQLERDRDTDLAIALYLVDLKRTPRADDPKTALKMLKTRLGAVGLTDEDMDQAVMRAMTLAHLLDQLKQTPLP